MIVFFAGGSCCNLLGLDLEKSIGKFRAQTIGHSRSETSAPACPVVLV